MFFCKERSWMMLVILLACNRGNAQETDTVQRMVTGRRNSAAQQAKPYVIMISADGFRYDYAHKYAATNLLRLSRQGVRARSMQPAFPSLTFPNHYTLATGLYPAHHGLVNNNFYDPTRGARYSMSNKTIAYDSSWYGGGPLWVLAEKEQLLAACFYWVGSEVAVQGVRPTYYYLYNEAIPINERLKTVKHWLQLPEAERPHLITFYFPEVDHEGHAHGPDSKETAAAVHFVDSAIGRLCAMVDSLQLPVNYVFVSDHGMAAADTVNTLRVPPVDTTRFVTVAGDVLVNYYAKDKALIPELYQQLKSTADGYDVYLPDESPAGWHYRKQDDRYNRIGDVLLVARYPRMFTWGNKRPNPGRHGYDPQVVKDMGATFMAWGPAFKKGKVIAPFENIHVYALVARILGLTIDQPVDSKENVLNKIIK
ncbi:alkaline phosphatase family protein [Paraflavitalea devenefica]|uniref:alkaline phosphatase family protein n=1 Tax=Paraflavitalea devenefica TaxID=2716334 RepID=UPI001ABA7818|nr:ectonucleotide pyrophosphatase/phosphodiesterase [Paraflavitalea devenefica]